MGKYTIIGLFFVAFFLAAFLVKRFVRNMIVSSEQKSFSVSKEKRPEDIFAENGHRRDFESAEYALPTKDFMEEEKTEYPDWMNDLCELSEEEAGKILEEADLYSDGEEQNGER